MNVRIMTGYFVWNELATTDTAAARKFYSHLFGWEFKKEELGEMEYYTARLGERMIGGLMPIAPREEIPSHWLSYVNVDDVDSRTEMAVRLGGKQIVPPRDIPKTGRFSVIRDPQGAYIAPFRALKEGDMPEGESQANAFCWHELLTPDPEGAKRFYQEVFGWGLQKHDMPEGEPYWMFKTGEKTVGGIWRMPPEADFPPHWLTYLCVEDVDAMARKVAEAGGEVMKEPQDIPDVGRFAVLRDNTGGVFAIYKGKE